MPQWYIAPMVIIACFALLVNDLVPTPYMDEIFHVPQAINYCKANFHLWDNKITTPPGSLCLIQAFTF
jgi:alpha-1,2-glucosyltransferase